MIAFELAHRAGTNVLMVMQNLYIVHGIPSWSSKYLISTINSCGKFSSLTYEYCGKEGEDTFGCRCRSFHRADVSRSEPLTGAWVTIDMAKKEGWYDKTGSKWKTIPQLMLQYRAATFWARTYAPELSMGIKTTDEVEDIKDDDFDVVKRGNSSVIASEVNKTLGDAKYNPGKVNAEGQSKVPYAKGSLREI